MPQPMVRAHIKWPIAAARKARAARPPPRTPPYMPMLPPPSGPFAPAGAEKVRAAADGSGAYQMAGRRRPQSTRGASSSAHAAIHADDAAALRPFTPTGAELSARTARPIARPTPFTPAGAEKAHAAADGSGTYQMTDRRRPQSTRGASSPAHAAYTPMMPLLCRVLQSSGPSRQRALKTSSRRPPHASQPSSRSHRLAEAGCAAADCGASITRTWYGVGVGCAAAAARCASAPVSVPESVACG